MCLLGRCVCVYEVGGGVFSGVSPLPWCLARGEWAMSRLISSSFLSDTSGFDKQRLTGTGKVFGEEGVRGGVGMN